MSDDTQQRLSWHSRLHRRLHANPFTGLLTKIVVSIIGVAVFVAGVIMLVIPGPGLVAMALGLAILATEWSWAHRATHWMTRQAKAAAERAGANTAERQRRVLIISMAGIVMVGAISVYVTFAGWPDRAVSAWDWVQDLNSAIPELPGM